MNAGRPPRVRGLVLALVAVLVLMGFAFWRAVAGSGAPLSRMKDEPAVPPTPAGPSGGAASTHDGAALAGGGGMAPAPPPLAQGASSHPAASKPGAAALDEPRLMTRLRAIKDDEPAAAVALAREGNRRFPDSADAPERTSILIHALVAIDKGSEARGEAEQMVNHYPDSAWVREVEHFTGAHRHRNVSVNDAGQLIFR